MDELLQTELTQNSHTRYKGYDRIMGNISWLLIAHPGAGLAGYPEDGQDVRTVLAHADEAMYASKRNGKNRLTLFDSTAAAASNLPPTESR